MTTDRALMLLRRFGPVVVLVGLFVWALASGVAGHISLEELRTRGEGLQAFAREKPLLSALIYVCVYVDQVPHLAQRAAVDRGNQSGHPGMEHGGFLYAAVAPDAALGSVLHRTAFGDVDLLTGKHRAARTRGFEHNAFSYLLTLRLIPAFPLLIVNVAAGLMAVPVRTFILASFMGMVPSSFVYAGIGAGLGHVFAQGGPVSLHTLLSPRIYLPIVGMGVLAFLPPLWRLWRQGRVAPAPDVK